MKNRVFAKKSLGQHFLKDENILNQSVALADVSKDSAVLEIGGGMGDLSRKIAPLCKKLFIVEKDEDMLPFLRVALDGFSNVHIILGDALKTNFEELLKEEENIQIVANLPYYLTTELMERFFLLGLPIKSISVMVQKEAGERILAPPNSRERGPLGLLAELKAECRGKIDVPAMCFNPPPNVDSLFLHFVAREKALVKQSEIPKLYKFFKLCFLNRRKTLVNNLLGLAPNIYPESKAEKNNSERANLGRNNYKEELEKLLLSLNLRRDIRAEALSLQSFIELASKLNVINL
ncbi:MAG: 16S rRNA (adenine(1518)-N(6)/adenine(1519)-N(6))-dimethyltransferase RsmA [Eubacteriales bacterium]|nr:16S rRNA (adenine(1518)-N(6)/adenine(1519)-N(6))-dimethyltransferase RsmA [Eubacteriales bacterium]